MCLLRAENECLLRYRGISEIPRDMQDQIDFKVGGGLCLYDVV